MIPIILFYLVSGTDKTELTSSRIPEHKTQPHKAAPDLNSYRQPAAGRSVRPGSIYLRCSLRLHSGFYIKTVFRASFKATHAGIPRAVFQLYPVIYPVHPQPSDSSLNVYQLPGTGELIQAFRCLYIVRIFFCIPVNNGNCQ